MLGKRCKCTGKGVAVDMKVTGYCFVFLFEKSAGHGLKCIVVG